MEQFLHILGIIGTIVFVAVLLLGFVASVVGLPGTVLIFVATLVYSACTGFDVIPWWLLLILAGMSAVAEIADNVISSAGAKRYGSTTRGMFAAMLGGLLGAVAGGFFVPAMAGIGLALGPVGSIALSLLAPIAGAFAGGFLGAWAYELRSGRPKDEAMRAGWGAFVGRAAGIVLKLGISGVMIALVLWRVFGG
jgi:hypothetical protein